VNDPIQQDTGDFLSWEEARAWKKKMLGNFPSIGQAAVLGQTQGKVN